MNFAKSQRRGPRGLCGSIVICAVALSILLFGCSDNVTLPTESELAEFQVAGPIMPEIDLDLLMASQGRTREYTVSCGDLLEVLLPFWLVQLSSEVTPVNSLSTSHFTRVDDDGNMSLPIVENILAIDNTLAELEKEIVKAYYPGYTTKKPTIVVRVNRYKTAQVTVTGAVTSPGIYELPMHKMTLISSIMHAGGIVEGGAAVIHINQPGDQSDWIFQEKIQNELKNADRVEEILSESRIHLSFQQTEPSGVGIVNVKDGDKLLYAEQLDVTDRDQRSVVIKNITSAHGDIPTDYITGRMCELADVIKPGSGGKFVTVSNELNETSQPSKKPLLLPVKGMNIPFSDIALADGASIVIEPLNPQVLTVMGLVKSPGVYPYPNNVKYNLLQAISFAGGVDDIANPRYVRVYRQKADGSIIDATFAMKDSIPTSAAALTIKPGDVVAVEQTLRTKFNLMFAEIFEIRLGAAASYWYYTGDDLRSGR